LLAFGLKNLVDHEQAEKGFTFSQMLRERHFGHWQGLTKSMVKEKYSDEVKADAGDWQHKMQGGGESRLDVLSRTMKILSQICQKYKENDRVLIVTHGGVISFLLASILRGTDLPFQKSFKVPNTGMTLIQATPVRCILSL